MANFYVPVAGVGVGDLPDNHHGLPRSGGRSHKGIDIFADIGTPVVAAKGGTVVKEGNAGLGGLRVWVQDDEGNFHYYAHLSAIHVKAGQRVEPGEMIGAVGDTGNAKGTDPHLHYSVNPNQHTSESGSFDAYQYLSSGGAVTMTSEQRHVDSATDVQGRKRRVEAGYEDPGDRSLETRQKKTRWEKQREGKELLKTAMRSMSEAVQSGQANPQMLDVKELLLGPRIGTPATFDEGTS